MSTLRTRLLQGLSFALFGAVAGTTGWLLLHPAATPARDPAVDVVCRVAPGEQVEFILPPGTGDVKLVSRVPAPDTTMPAAAWVDYAFRVEWLGPDGEVVDTRDFWERGRRSTFIGARGAEPWRDAWLPPGQPPVTDGRLTRISGGETLPSGGILRFTSLDPARPTWVKAFAETTMPRDPDIHRISQKTREDLTNRVGLVDWRLLSDLERNLLAGTSWKGLSPRGRRGEDYQSSWLASTDYQLTVDQARTTRLQLAPGRKLALNLVGPVTVRLSGEDGVTALTAGVIRADAPLAEADPFGEAASPLPPVLETVKPRPGTPLGLAGESTALFLEIPFQGPLSLHLANPSQRTVGPFYLSVDDPDPSRFLGWTAVARLSDLLPDLAVRTRDPALVAPEWRTLHTWRTGPTEEVTWPTPAPVLGGVMRLDLRRFLAGPDDTAPLEVTVEAMDATGTPRWTRSAALPTNPAPYEYAEIDQVSDPTRWLSEPVDVSFACEPGVQAVRVRTATPAVVTASVPGPEAGDDALYVPPDRLRSVDVRYAWRALTPWSRVDPMDRASLVAAGQDVRVAANVRLEARQDLAEDQVLRAYTSVAPTDGGEGRLWMAPASDQPVEGPWYCRFGAGATDQPFAFAGPARLRLGGILSGLLVTPGASALDTPYTVRLDGETWQSGRFHQRVEAFASASPSHTRVSLDAPGGATLWLRTWGVPGTGCPGAHRPIRAWRVEPGRSLTFLVEKTLDQQLVLVGGLAGANASVHLEVDGGRPDRRVGLHSAVTQAVRDLPLPVQDVQAWILEDPDSRLRLLDTGAILLGPDLPPGPHRIVVTNRAPIPVWLRGAIETREAGDFAEYRQARLLQSRGESP